MIRRRRTNRWRVPSTSSRRQLQASSAGLERAWPQGHARDAAAARAAHARSKRARDDLVPPQPRRAGGARGDRDALGRRRRVEFRPLPLPRVLWARTRPPTRRPWSQADSRLGWRAAQGEGSQMLSHMKSAAGGRRGGENGNGGVRTAFVVGVVGADGVQPVCGVQGGGSVWEEGRAPSRAPRRAAPACRTSSRRAFSRRPRCGPHRRQRSWRRTSSRSTRPSRSWHASRLAVRPIALCGRVRRGALWRPARAQRRTARRRPCRCTSSSRLVQLAHDSQRGAAPTMSQTGSGLTRRDAETDAARRSSRR